MSRGVFAEAIYSRQQLHCENPFHVNRLAQTYLESQFCRTCPARMLRDSREHAALRSFSLSAARGSGLKCRRWSRFLNGAPDFIELNITGTGASKRPYSRGSASLQATYNQRPEVGDAVSSATDSPLTVWMICHLARSKTSCPVQSGRVV